MKKLIPLSQADAAYIASRGPLKLSEAPGAILWTVCIGSVGVAALVVVGKLLTGWF